MFPIDNPSRWYPRIAMNSGSFACLLPLLTLLCLPPGRIENLDSLKPPEACACRALQRKVFRERFISDMRVRLKCFNSHLKFVGVPIVGYGGQCHIHTLL